MSTEAGGFGDLPPSMIEGDQGVGDEARVAMLRAVAALHNQARDN